MEEIVTYLEMTGVDELRPGRPAPGLNLASVELDHPRLHETLGAVGAAYYWPSAKQSPAEWRVAMADSAATHHLIMIDDVVAGVSAFAPRRAGEVEIVTFGLLPAFVGRGYGGAALTETVRLAWATDPPEALPVRRVWLHTSTLDHPNALANYRRRGFRAFHRETRTRR
jgi:GNAT superfamily N-acetyltransferase